MKLTFAQQVIIQHQDVHITNVSLLIHFNELNEHSWGLNEYFETCCVFARAVELGQLVPKLVDADGVNGMVFRQADWRTCLITITSQSCHLSLSLRTAYLTDSSSGWSEDGELCLRGKS